jgi:branched-chain amino acid transport system substrate-binding protein
MAPHRVTFISYDDAYSPPKAVEQARKLVESDEVPFILNPLGTPSVDAPTPLKPDNFALPQT